MSQQSFHQQTANGSNIAFTITTFSEDEIKVYVDGVESTNGGSSQNDYTIPNYTTSGGTVTTLADMTLGALRVGKLELDGANDAIDTENNFQMKCETSDRGKKVIK